jgi:hypothetical protein
LNGNFDTQKLIDAIVAQSGGKIKREAMNSAIGNNDFSALLGSLSAADQAKIQAAMSDKGTLQMLLQSKEAKAILKNFLG